MKASNLRLKEEEDSEKEKGGGGEKESGVGSPIWSACQMSNVKFIGLPFLTTPPLAAPPQQSSFVRFPSVINLWQRPETGVGFLAARPDKQSVLGKRR